MLENLDISTVIELVLQVIGVATLLLQLIPQLDKKNKAKPMLQFIGKWIALNKPLLYKKK